MNTFAILGYVVAICLAPVAPFLLHRWIGAAWQAAKALRVLSREQRTGETLYDTAEAIAGDAHNWRGMTSPIGCVEDVVDDNKEPGLAAAVRRVRAERIASAPQPPPQNHDGPALWPMIISELEVDAQAVAGCPNEQLLRLVAADMQQRHKFGVAKYGIPLVASNGRDHFADAYQEALDGVVYLRAAIESMHDPMDKKESIRFGRARQLYVDALDAAKEIRELIRERDGQ
jgi:hypothetical protein